jgi:anti-sigma-K factor RskA
MSDADLHLLSGAYAVDALDAEERVAFERHLATCPTCTDEVAELQATAAVLAAAESTTPPSRLRESVLAQVRATPQTARDEGQSPAVGAPMHRLSTRLLAAAAAVLAVALVGVGAWGIAAHRTTARLTAEAAQVSSVLTAPDATTSTGAVGTGGRGTVVTSVSQGASVFVGSGLSEPGADKTYQLWYIDSSGSARSAGTFRPGPDGSAVAPLEGRPAGATTVGLTVEPSGGSAAPTTAPVLAVPLAV